MPNQDTIDLAKRAHRSLRRRIHALLRMAHRVMGMKDKRLGVGSLTAGGGVSCRISAAVQASGGLVNGHYKVLLASTALALLGVVGLSPDKAWAQLSCSTVNTAIGSIPAQNTMRCSPSTGQALQIIANQDGAQGATPEDLVLGGGGNNGTSGISQFFRGGIDNSNNVFVQIGDPSRQGSRFNVYANQMAIGMGAVAIQNTFAIGVNSNASGATAEAMGYNANASGSNAIAVGTNTQAIGANAIAVGVGSLANGLNAVAIARGSQAMSDGDVAIGQGAYANGANATGTGFGTVALGASAVAKNTAGGITAGVAIGGFANATSTATNGSSPVAIGPSANASGTGSQVAIGDQAKATGKNAVGIGGNAFSTGTAATGDYSVAIGAGTQAGGLNSLAFGGNVGGGANAAAANSIAIGAQSLVAAAASSGIAIGRGAAVNGANGIAMGDGTISGSTGQNVAIGSGGTIANSTTATGTAVAIGGGQKATGDGAVAIGDPNVSNGTGAVAVGANNTAAGNAAGTAAAAGAVAIGNANFAVGQGSVSLGNQSNAAAAGALAFGDKATGAATNAVALGSGSNAGNANDVALGAGSTTAAVVNTPSGTINGTSYAYAGNAANSTVSIGSSGKERTLTNLAAGRISATSTDAVNGSQLFATNQAVNAIGTSVTTIGNNVNNLGNSTASNLGGGSTYNPATGTVSAPSYTIGGATYNNVGNAFNAVNTSVTALQTDALQWNKTLGAYDASHGSGSPQKITNVANGAVTSTSTDAVNGQQLYDVQQTASKGWNANTGTVAGSTGTASGSALTNIAPGGTVTYQAGNNIAITQTGNTIAIATSMTPTFTSVTAGNSKLDTTGLTITGGPSVTTAGINAASKSITNVANGVAATDAVNLSQLNTVSTSVTALGNNLNNLGNTTASTLGGGTTFNTTTGTLSGFSQNINPISNTGAVGAAATQTTVAGALTQLNTNTSNLANIAVKYDAPGGNKITLGATGGAGAPAGGVTITNLANGAVTASSTDAVNGSQLLAVQQTANKGWNLSTNKGATTSNIAPGGTVDLNNSDGNVVITQAGPNATFNLASNLAIASSITVGNSKLDTTGLTITGGPSVTTAGINAASKSITNVANGVAATDAVNLSQLNTVSTSVTTVGNNLNNLGNTTASTLGGGTTYDPNTGTLSGFSQNVTAIDGKGNVGATKGYTTVAGALTQLDTNTTNLANAAVKYDDPAVKDRITLGNAGTPVTIGNVANGVAANDAVNVSQLQAVGANANAGWNLSTGGNTAGKSNIGPGGTVDLSNTDGNIVIAHTGPNATFNLASNLNIANSITVGNSKLDTTGLTITGGPSVTTAGINAASKSITNVAAGTNATDAVNLSQLNTVSTSVTTIGNNINNLGNSTASNLGGGSTYNPATGTVSAPSYTIGGTTYNNVGNAFNAVNTSVTALQTDALQWNKTLGAYDASHGSGSPQKITNVANGAVTSTSTDAVNGQQLYDVQQTASKGWNANTGTVAGSTGTASGSALTNIAPGGTVTYQAGNNIAITQTGNTIAIATSMTPTFTSVTAGNSKLDTTGLTITGGPSVTTAGIDAGGKAITNVAAGTNATDAVNLSQLNTVSTSVTTIGNNVNNLGNSTASTIGGGTTFDTGTGTLSGFSQNVTAIDGKGNAAASATNFTTVAGALTQLDTNTTNLANVAVKYDDPAVKDRITLGNAGTPVTIGNVANGVAANDAVNVSQLDAVSQTASKGWTLSTNKGATTSKVAPGDTVDLSNTDGNVVIGQSGTNATFDLASNVKIANSLSIGAVTIDTTSVVVGASKLDATGLVINGGPSVTTAGVDGGGKKITNVANGDVTATSTDAINGSQLFAVVGNATANAVQYDDATRTKITLGGAGATQPTQITNLANGAVAAGSTDAVNGSQLYDVQQTANKGWNLTANGADSSNVAPGDTVDLNNTDGNLAITKTGNAVTFNLSKDIAVDSVTTGNSTLDTTGLTIAGGPSVTTAGIDAGGKAITNVATGTNATDAVNLSQLNTVSTSVTTIGNNVNNLGNSTASTIGGGSTYDPNTGTLSSFNQAVTAIDAKGNAAGAPTTYTTVGGALTQLDTNTTNLANAAVKYDDPAVKDKITLGGIGASDLTLITNLAKGNIAAASTDAVNGSQLYAVSNSVADNLGGGSAVNPDGTVSAPSYVIGGNTYNNVGNALGAVDTSVTALQTDALQWNSTLGAYDASHGSGSPQKISNVANGVAANDAVNVSQLQAVGNNANAGWNLSTGGDTANKSNVGPGGTVDLSNTDGNIVIAHNGANATFDLAKSITLDSVTAGGNTLDATGLTVGGTTVTTNGLTITGGPSVTTAGIDAGGKAITNVAAGTNATDAVNVGQLQAVGNSANNLGNSTASTLGGGTTYDPVTGTLSGFSQNVTAIDGKGNAAASATNFTTVAGALTQLDANTTNLANAAVKYDDPAVKDRITLGNAGTPVTIGNVANGVAATDAVNVSQLQAVGANANAGWNLSTGGDTANKSNVGPGGTVDLSNTDGNIVIAHNGTNATFDLAKSITLDSVTAGGNTLDATGLTVGGTTVTTNGLVITGGPSVTTAGIDAGGKAITNVAAGTNATDAVNVGQLQAVGNSANNLGNSVASSLGGGSSYDPTTGTVSAPSYVIGGTAYNDVGNAFNAVNTSVTALQTDALQWNSTLGAYDASHGSGSPQKITNVANGDVSATSTDAITGQQLYDVQQTANKGWNLSANGANSSNVAPGDTVDLNNTDGNIAIAKSGNAVTFNLANDVTIVSSLTIGAARIDTTGLVIDGGPSVLISGIDAGSKTITNVAAGTNATDAANVGQLQTVSNAANNLGNSVASNLGGGSSYDPTTGTVSAPSYNIGGTSYNNVGSTFTAVNTSLTALQTDALQWNSALGAYDASHGSGAPQKISNLAAGVADTDAVNVQQLNNVASTANKGWNLTANGADSSNVAPGGTVDLSNTDGNIAITKTGNDVTFNLSKNITVDSVTAGNTTIDTNGLTIAGGPSVTINGIDAGGKKITNVANGTDATDAVNLSQLNAVSGSVTTIGNNLNNLGNSTATNLGGGATYDSTTGKVSAPTYNVYGTTQNNVGAAITALQSNSPVQYSNPDTPTIPNGNVPTNSVTLFGTGGPVTLSNVANGAVNASSTQAINGQQLYGSAQSVAAALGGNTTVDDKGQLTGTSYKLSTGTYNDVGSALTALDKRFDGIGGSIANLQSQVSNNLKEARKGIASAMAASALRYDDRPGKVSAAAGMAVYHRQVGIAAGLGWTSEDAKWRANLAGTYSPGGRKPDFGVMGGLSYTFN
ncbi:hypothetical protein J8I29_18945 [Labrys sp. LIt4]|uniref:hypothetical protein n=1 Tax=Labrys sp. LIt4 TaxID=2821355 RepID=UPI001ADFC5EF|nr:hypothetical protein [Labrys sp. LIt4]MBP0581414.1 hypothetical protein [Labrys sp. LIt4]